LCLDVPVVAVYDTLHGGQANADAGFFLPMGAMDRLLTKVER